MKKFKIIALALCLIFVMFALLACKPVVKFVDMPQSNIEVDKANPTFNFNFKCEFNVDDTDKVYVLTQKFYTDKNIWDVWDLGELVSYKINREGIKSKYDGKKGYLIDNLTRKGDNSFDATFNLKDSFSISNNTKIRVVINVNYIVDNKRTGVKNENAKGSIKSNDIILQIK